jgi:hypothetical protein
MGGMPDTLMKDGLGGIMPMLAGNSGLGGILSTLLSGNGGQPGGVPGGEVSGGAPAPIVPPTRQNPGYSSPVSLFGNLSPQQLAQYATENGVNVPGKPPMMDRSMPIAPKKR